MTVFKMGNNQSTSQQMPLRCILNSWKLIDPLSLRVVVVVISPLKDSDDREEKKKEKTNKPPSVSMGGLP